MDSIAPFEATLLHYRVRLELRAITYFKIVTSCASWRHPDVFLGIARLIRSILAYTDFTFATMNSFHLAGPKQP